MSFSETAKRFPVAPSASPGSCVRKSEHCPNDRAVAAAAAAAHFTFPPSATSFIRLTSTCCDRPFQYRIAGIVDFLVRSPSYGALKSPTSTVAYKKFPLQPPRHGSWVPGAAVRRQVYWQVRALTDNWQPSLAFLSISIKFAMRENSATFSTGPVAGIPSPPCIATTTAIYITGNTATKDQSVPQESVNSAKTYVAEGRSWQHYITPVITPVHQHTLTRLQVI